MPACPRLAAGGFEQQNAVRAAGARMLAGLLWLEPLRRYRLRYCSNPRSLVQAQDAARKLAAVPLPGALLSWHPAFPGKTRITRHLGLAARYFAGSCQSV